MKLLVTGGTGVVGAAVVPELLMAGHQLRLLTRHAEKDAGAYPADVEPVAANIARAEDVADIAAGCDAVVHIAGIAEERPPHVTFEAVNVAGTRHLLTAARRAGLPRFIFLSSLGADRGQSAYHHSKLRAEELVRDYPGPWLILRPGAVYGPGDETISTLLKMMRSLPAVPLIENGQQPFQPLWYRDLGRLVALAVDHDEWDHEVLELAGPDVTTTAELLDRLATLTGRNPPRVAVPEWLARFGTTAAESLGALGNRVLRQSGFDAPINSAKLQMLIEGSVIPEERRNALLARGGLPATSLPDGLAMLADLLPETPPGQGVGMLERTVYAADIHECTLDAAGLMERVAANLGQVMPVEFSPSPSHPRELQVGQTLTGGLPGRGQIQVRLEERAETRLTFSTVSGHPLAAMLTFEAEPASNGLRFSIRIVSQPANLVDWFVLRTVGGAVQAQNWRKVVRRVIRLAGGNAPAGVQRTTRLLGETEAREMAEWADGIVQRRKRAEMEREIAGSKPGL